MGTAVPSIDEGVPAITASNVTWPVSVLMSRPERKLISRVLQAKEALEAHQRSRGADPPVSVLTSRVLQAKESLESSRVLWQEAVNGGLRSWRNDASCRLSVHMALGFLALSSLLWWQGGAISVLVCLGLAVALPGYAFLGEMMRNKREARRRSVEVQNARSLLDRLEPALRAGLGAERVRHEMRTKMKADLDRHTRAYVESVLEQSNQHAFQLTGPTQDPGRFWLYRGSVYQLDRSDYSGHEVALLIDEANRKRRRRFERLERRLSGDSIATARRERIDEEVRDQVWRRDSGRCARCGSRERLEFDHIVPLSSGGGSTARNVELLCEACNRAKGAHVS